MKKKIFFLCLAAILFAGCIEPDGNNACVSMEKVQTAFEEESKCLIVFDEKVFDVTNVSDWSAGSHKMQHNCGESYDAETIEIGPHGIDAMNRFFVGEVCK